MRAVRMKSSDSLFWWTGSSDRRIFAYNLCAVVQEPPGLTRRFDVHLNSVRGRKCHPLFFRVLTASEHWLRHRFPLLMATMLWLGNGAFPHVSSRNIPCTVAVVFPARARRAAIKNFTRQPCEDRPGQPAARACFS